MKNPSRWTSGLVAVGALGLVPSMSAQTLFSDNFDTNTSASWSVYRSDADTDIVFGFDYSTLGIPSAPNSGGSTLGVRFAANLVAPTGTAGLNMVPIGQNFTGNYILKYDLWMNVNGPLPGGGAGSTEFASAGIGLAGNGALQWSGSAPAGTGWFGVSGEGGAAQDFRAYVGGTLQPEGGVYYATGTATRDAGNAYYAATFPAGTTPPDAQVAGFAQQTGSLNVGTIGFAWRSVEVSRIGDEVVWSIDGLPIAHLSGSGNGVSLEGNISIGYFDPFSSVSDNPNLSFGLVDNVRVEVVPEPGTIALGVLGLGGLLAAGRRFRRR